jgi:hypothetical protein
VTWPGPDPARGPPVVHRWSRRCWFYWPTPLQLQLQSPQSLVLLFFLSRSTSCTGAPFLVACLLATELFGTITSFPSSYLEFTELFGILSMGWYSLGADHTENTASNCTSIVARGPLPSNGSNTVAYLRSCYLAMNLWWAGFLGNTSQYYTPLLSYTRTSGSTQNQKMQILGNSHIY